MPHLLCSSYVAAAMVPIMKNIIVRIAGAATMLPMPKLTKIATKKPMPSSCLK